MLEEKKRILAIRFVWFCIFLLSTITPIALTFLGLFNIILLIVPFAWSIIFICFIGSLQLSCNEHEHGSYKIIVYAGASIHYIKVNDIIVDKCIGVFNYIPISLSCLLTDGTKLDVSLSSSNKCLLKINDIAVKNAK